MKTEALHYYDKFGFNITKLTAKKNNYNYSKDPYKHPSHSWEFLTYERQQREFLSESDWDKTVGIGTVLGFNKLRALDIDDCNDLEFLLKVLIKLGLPKNYEWIIKSGSNNGYHILFFAEDNKLSNSEYIKPAYRSNELNKDIFKRIEFRWKKHLVLPPSLHKSGNIYGFLFSNPINKPLAVDLKNIISIIKSYCYFKQKFYIVNQEISKIDEYILSENLNLYSSEDNDCTSSENEATNSSENDECTSSENEATNSSEDDEYTSSEDETTNSSEDAYYSSSENEYLNFRKYSNSEKALHNTIYHNYDDAIQYLLKAINKNPNNPSLYYKQSVVYNEKGDLKRSIKACNKAIKLNPDNSEYYYHRAKLYSKNNATYDKATSDLEKAIQLNPNNPELQYFANNKNKQNNENSIREISLFDSIKKALVNDTFKKGKLIGDLKEYSKLLDYDSKDVIFKIIEDLEKPDKKKRNLWKKDWEAKERKDYKVEMINMYYANYLHRTEKILIKENYNKKLQNMVKEYTHSLGNTIFPKNIYEVSKNLKNGILREQDISVLERAYRAEKSMQSQSLLLATKMSQNKSSFQTLIRSDRINNNDENYVNIKDILTNSIEIILSRFLNEDYGIIKKIRENTIAPLNSDLKIIKQSYENHIFSDKKTDIFSWLAKNFLTIDFNITSKFWTELKVVKEKHSHTQLEVFFIELLLNSLKYRDKNNSKWLSIELSDKESDNESYLVALFTNEINIKDSKSKGSKEGLKSLKNSILLINDSNKRNILYKKSNNKFIVEMFLQKDLFVHSEINFTKDLKKRSFK